MGWIKRRIYLILAAAKAALLAWVYFKGWQDAKDERAARDMRDYHDTRKRMDQVVRDNDSADSREFLRERGTRK
jgi:hypothetical protein